MSFRWICLVELVIEGDVVNLGKWVMLFFLYIVKLIMLFFFYNVKDVIEIIWGIVIV